MGLQKLKTVLNYKSLGFKCGLEVHQQLNTNKLFCNCRSELAETFNERQSFFRILNVTESELGEVDKAAMFEKSKNKKFKYFYDSKTSCLVEADEEPPHELNRKALEIALQFSKLVNAKPVDEIHVMRKIVVDGSNTTGFQRTALVATHGEIDSSKGKVGIATITLEEDSARKLQGHDNVEEYGLDRLGFPLIEISTDASIQDPKHAREVAEKIGLYLRSLDVKRGLGTIRQDLNVSIEKGARVEIKGVQQLDLIDKTLDYEVRRQLALLDLKEELLRRCDGAIPENFTVKEVTKLFESCDSNLVKKSLDKGLKVFAISMPYFSGLLSKKFREVKHFGRELADIVKVKAGLGGLLHSDELPNYGITSKEVKAVRNALSLKTKDAFILIIAEENKAKIAIDAIIERAKQAFLSIPEEVRKANEDGSTTYLRPMPGSARMYPETDTLPAYPFEVETPKLITEVEKEIVSLGVPHYLAKEAAKEKVPVVDLAKKYKNVKPMLIVEIILNMPKEIRRKYGVEIGDIQDHLKEFEKIISEIDKGNINRKGAFECLVEFFMTGNLRLKKYYLIKGKDLEKVVKDFIKKESVPSEKALIGKLMDAYKGRIEYEDLKKVLDKIGKKKK